MVYTIAFVGLLIFLFSSLKAMVADGNQEIFTALMIIGAAMMILFPLIPTMQSTPVSSQVAKILDVEEKNIIVEDLTEDSGFLGLGPSRNNHLRRIYVDGKTYIAEMDGFNVEKITEESVQRTP